MAIAAASLGGSAALYALWVHPVSGSDWATSPVKATLAAAIVMGIVQCFIVLTYVLVSDRTTYGGLVACGALVPLVTAGLALAQVDDHRHQRQADAVFTRYTGRFRPGVLHDRFLYQQEGGYVTECARQGRGDLFFCLEINLEAGTVGGGEVVGGYRWRTRDQGVDNATRGIAYPRDCFGRPVACGY